VFRRREKKRKEKLASTNHYTDVRKNLVKASRKRRMYGQGQQNIVTLSKFKWTFRNLKNSKASKDFQLAYIKTSLVQRFTLILDRESKSSSASYHMR
jgi:hypothetical protein